ncbi:MAG: cytochrome c3 family protein [Candidatus Omnitrophota bacterium]|nr:cytochrome c3 family protein [Candidatus Omnitrophota bacterium]
MSKAIIHHPLFAISCSLMFLILSFTPPCFAGSIVSSKHNLSLSGPGNVKASSESEICIFCHTPHNASTQAPLWNRYDSGQVYIPYTSTTLKAKTGQPTGASKLCLSCHDGTVALGMVRSRSQPIQFTQALTGEDNLSTDLSNDHPVSFRYDSSLASTNGQLKDPAGFSGSIRLDKDAQLQCTSCHDPHNDQFGSFLRVDAARGSLCLTCHTMNGWDESIHKNSTASWNGASTNPWKHTAWNNVADNACQNCHTPHNAGGKKRLLNYTNEEDNCLSCHNGNVAQKNILSEFNKISTHPIYNASGLHDPAEETIVTSNRHVECADCHNPHAASDTASGSLPGALRKVRGVNAQGLAVDEIKNEYELCFRCHADSNYTGRFYTNRQYPESNVRLQFDPSNQSYHPIENIGRNANVPSLVAGLTNSSIIRCIDCHNNNASRGNFGVGPEGPHGSLYSPLLARNLIFGDYQGESLNTYALCYKCHDRSSILGNKSFSKHRKHIVDAHAPCTACHDPHGVRNTPHLINFDRNIVGAYSYDDEAGEGSSYTSEPSYQSNGPLHGSCTLTCHGKGHRGKRY